MICARFGIGADRPVNPTQTFPLGQMRCDDSTAGSAYIQVFLHDGTPVCRYMFNPIQSLTVAASGTVFNLGCSWQ